MAKSDKENLYKMVYDKVPCVEASKIKMAADAPAATAYLQRRGLSDLADMLGLNDFVKEGVA